MRDFSAAAVVTTHLKVSVQLQNRAFTQYA
jgi:hypothetical protein